MKDFINNILTAIFGIPVQMAFEKQFLYKNRSFRDGITFFEFIFNTDFYWDDHKPSIELMITVGNLCLVELRWHNMLHLDLEEDDDEY